MLIITKLIAKYVIVYYTILLSFLVFENFHLKYVEARKRLQQDLLLPPTSNV